MSTVVKKGKIIADNVDSYVVSVQNTVSMDNGSQIIVGTPVTGQLGVYNCTAPTDVTKNDVYMVLNPVLVEINGLRINWSDPSAFTNAANRSALAVKISMGDEFVITTPGFSGTPTVGQYVVPANGALTLAPAADLTGGTTIAYSVIASESVSIGMSYITGYRIRCIKSL